MPAAPPLAAAATGVVSDPASDPKAILLPLPLPRKRLSDITNLATDGRVAAAKSIAIGAKENPNSAVAVKDAYIAQLLKENNALMRALAERNNVIEFSAAEVQSLRMGMQKLTHQNQQLGRANSQMLAERTRDKDRLKNFQHELGCTNAVLKAKGSELKEKMKLIRELRLTKGCEEFRAGQSEADNGMGDAPIPANQMTFTSNRKRTLRSQSLGPAAVKHDVASLSKEESSRKSSKRRSVRSKHGLWEVDEDVYIVEERSPVAITLTRDDPMSDANTNEVKSSNCIPYVPKYKVKEEVQEFEPIGTPQVHYSGERRSSIGRPLRRAAEKVTSYREVSINTKMRRPE